MAPKKRRFALNFVKTVPAALAKADWTRQFATGADADQDESPRDERISGKGELTRRRTVVADVEEGETAPRMGHWSFRSIQAFVAQGAY